MRAAAVVAVEPVMLRLVLPLPLVVVLFAVLSALLASCGSSQSRPSSAAAPVASQAPLEPIAFRPSRFAGTWYVVARLDIPQERGLTDATMSYMPGPNRSILVRTRAYDPATGAWSEDNGAARFVGHFRTADLRVRFDDGEELGLKVLDLDHEQRPYQWALAGSDDRARCWILSREPRLDDDARQRLVARAQALGFPADRLVAVKHGVAPAAVQAASTARR